MSAFIENLKARAKEDLKTIVLAEGEELRTIQCADIVKKEGYAKVVLLGNPEKINAVAKAENLEVTEEDFVKECETMAEVYQMEADKVKEMLGEEGKKSVMKDLVIQKAMDFVADNAKAKKATKKAPAKKAKAENGEVAEEKKTTKKAAAKKTTKKADAE